MLIKFGGWDLAASDGPTKFLACNSQKEYTLVLQSAFLTKDDPLASTTLTQKRSAKIDLSQPNLYMP